MATLVNAPETYLTPRKIGSVYTENGLSNIVKKMSWMWHAPGVPACGRQRQEDQVPVSILDYTVSLRLARQ